MVVAQLADGAFERGDEIRAGGRGHRARAPLVAGRLPRGALRAEIGIALVEGMPERIEILGLFVRGRSGRGGRGGEDRRRGDQGEKLQTTLTLMS
jgi:hypothetical protein